MGMGDEFVAVQEAYVMRRARGISEWLRSKFGVLRSRSGDDWFENKAVSALSTLSACDYHLILNHSARRRGSGAPKRLRSISLLLLIRLRIQARRAAAIESLSRDNAGGVQAEVWEPFLIWRHYAGALPCDFTRS